MSGTNILDGAVYQFLRRSGARVHRRVGDSLEVVRQCGGRFLYRNGGAPVGKLDGKIYPIIGDFVEIGLVILNPIQPRSMDPARLKRDFGKHLAFWGSVDVQQVLPFGTVDDVVNEVKRRLRTVGEGAGMILAPAHAIQPETPLENVLAFYATAKNCGRYPLRGD